MKINRLEDLEVWQEALKLGKIVYELTKTFPKEEKYNLVKHMRENARGIPANIGEGFGRFFYKESLHFYGYARGCLLELKSDLWTSYQAGYVKKDDLLKKYLAQLDLVGRKLNALINNVSLKAKGKHRKIIGVEKLKMEDFLGWHNN